MRAMVSLLLSMLLTVCGCAPQSPQPAPTPAPETEEAGYSGKEIDALLHLEIPDNAYFNAMGIYNYHGGGSVLFDREDIHNWILEQQKEEKEN